MRSRLRIVTMVILGLTTGFMVAQAVEPSVLAALRRTPTMLSDRELWRFVTPVLVHSGGWPHFALNAVLLAISGTLLERRRGPRLTAFAYLGAAIAGEIVGSLWRPHGAGASVGVAGLVGALIVTVARTGARKLVAYAFVLGACALSVVARDVHGLPLLVGAAIGDVSTRSARGT